MDPADLAATKASIETIFRLVGSFRPEKAEGDRQEANKGGRKEETKKTWNGRKTTNQANKEERKVGEGQTEGRRRKEEGRRKEERN